MASTVNFLSSQKLLIEKSRYSFTRLYRYIANIMESKATMKAVPIFTGKEKIYNEKMLTLLYDFGPLTAWELTGKITNTSKVSLHATLNKRLRALEEKEYLQRIDKKWHLRFKGILAVLIIRPDSKKWNNEWEKIFAAKEKLIEENAKPVLNRYNMDFHSALKTMGLSLDDFTESVELSKKVKQLSEDGRINFDIIKEGTLFATIIMETIPLEEMLKLWNYKNQLSAP